MSRQIVIFHATLIRVNFIIILHAPFCTKVFFFYAENFDITHKKVEELEEHYSNVKRMLDKKLTKDNLEKMLF